MRVANVKIHVTKESLPFLKFKKILFYDQNNSKIQLDINQQPEELEGYHFCDDILEKTKVYLDANNVEFEEIDIIH